MIMRQQKGFTLIELLVVIAIIALLLAILMPSLQRVKKQAQATACIGRLKQWGLIFAMYTGDNNGYFHTREYGTNYEKMWPQFYRSYYNDHLMRCCPAAQNPNTNTGPFATWGWKGAFADEDWGWGGSWVPEEGFFGSYAMNRYMLNRDDEPVYWRKTGIKNADTIPVFLDSLYVAIRPEPTNAPPEYDGQRVNEMQFSCINRHSGYVNGLFLDWSVRKIGLKELWTLRWSRTFDTEGPWTTAGQATPNDWPEWMKSFKDY
jgi:prepilin-type N-terminal cleavage/methylation domain-containing protein/prepilin-type processing-associated H-X9-DG protein